MKRLLTADEREDRLQWALGIIRGMEVAPLLKKLIEEAFKQEGRNGT
jgi:hypothetical protein